VQEGPLSDEDLTSQDLPSTARPDPSRTTPALGGETDTYRRDSFENFLLKLDQDILSPPTAPPIGSDRLRKTRITANRCMAALKDCASFNLSCRRSYSAHGKGNTDTSRRDSAAPASLSELSGAFDRAWRGERSCPRCKGSAARPCASKDLIGHDRSQAGPFPGIPVPVQVAPRRSAMRRNVGFTKRPGVCTVVA
jgi:hypothetical protein